MVASNSRGGGQRRSWKRMSNAPSTSSASTGGAGGDGAGTAPPPAPAAAFVQVHVDEDDSRSGATVSPRSSAGGRSPSGILRMPSNGASPRSRTYGRLTRRVSVPVMKEEAHEETAIFWDAFAPKGWVTLVFLTVNGEDRLKAGCPDVYDTEAASCLAEARDLLVEHEGYEVLAWGSSMYAAFHTAHHGMNFANALHLRLVARDPPTSAAALYEHPLAEAVRGGGPCGHLYRGLRVSIGISTGKPRYSFLKDPNAVGSPTDDLGVGPNNVSGGTAEGPKRIMYTGPPARTAALLATIADGGQTLISTTTYKELAPYLCDQNQVGSPLLHENAVDLLGWEQVRDPGGGQVLSLQVLSVLPRALEERERTFVKDLLEDRLQTPILDVFSFMMMSRCRGSVVAQGSQELIETLNETISDLQLEVQEQKLQHDADAHEIAALTEQVAAAAAAAAECKAASDGLAARCAELEAENVRLEGTAGAQAERIATLTADLEALEPLGHEMPLTSDDPRVVVLRALTKSVADIYEAQLKALYPEATEVNVTWTDSRRHDPGVSVVAHCVFDSEPAAEQAAEDAGVTPVFGVQPNVVFRGIVMIDDTDDEDDDDDDPEVDGGDVDAAKPRVQRSASRTSRQSQLSRRSRSSNRMVKEKEQDAEDAVSSLDLDGQNAAKRVRRASAATSDAAGGHPAASAVGGNSSEDAGAEEAGGGGGRESNPLHARCTSAETQSTAPLQLAPAPTTAKRQSRGAIPVAANPAAVGAVPARRQPSGAPVQKPAANSGSSAAPGGTNRDVVMHEPKQQGRDRNLWIGTGRAPHASDGLDDPWDIVNVEDGPSVPWRSTGSHYPAGTLDSAEQHVPGGGRWKALTTQVMATLTDVVKEWTAQLTPWTPADGSDPRLLQLPRTPMGEGPRRAGSKAHVAGSAAVGVWPPRTPTSPHPGRGAAGGGPVLGPPQLQQQQQQQQDGYQDVAPAAAPAGGGSSMRGRLVSQAGAPAAAQDLMQLQPPQLASTDPDDVAQYVDEVLAWADDHERQVQAAVAARAQQVQQQQQQQGPQTNVTAESITRGASTATLKRTTSSMRPMLSMKSLSGCGGGPPGSPAAAAAAAAAVTSVETAALRHLLAAVKDMGHAVSASLSARPDSPGGGGLSTFAMGGRGLRTHRSVSIRKGISRQSVSGGGGGGGAGGARSPSGLRTGPRAAGQRQVDVLDAAFSDGRSSITFTGSPPDAAGGGDDDDTFHIANLNREGAVNSEASFQHASKMSKLMFLASAFLALRLKQHAKEKARRNTDVVGGWRISCQRVKGDLHQLYREDRREHAKTATLHTDAAAQATPGTCEAGIQTEVGREMSFARVERRKPRSPQQQQPLQLHDYVGMAHGRGTTPHPPPPPAQPRKGLALTAPPSSAQKWSVGLFPIAPVARGRHSTGRAVYSVPYDALRKQQHRQQRNHHLADLDAEFAAEVAVGAGADGRGVPRTPESLVEYPVTARLPQI